MDRIHPMGQLEPCYALSPRHFNALKAKFILLGKSISHWL